MGKIHKDIKPGTGLGTLKFGMTREQVKVLLGEPDFSEIVTYDEEAEEACDSWEYHELRLDLSFDSEEDWRLTILSVSSEDYLYDDSSLIGLEFEDLLEELEILRVSDYEIEADEEEGQLIAVDHLALNFWIRKDVLQEIQWSVYIDEENQIQWPS